MFKGNDLIRVISRENIDVEKWNALNNLSVHPYFTSTYYLDAVCKNWSALVYGEYLTCFPIYVRKFVSWKIITQPLFVRTSSFIGNKENLPQMIQFLEANFSFVHVFIEEHSLIEKPKVKKRKFQKLFFQNELESPFHGFHQNAKRQLGKFKKSGATINSIEQLKELDLYIDFFYAQKKENLKNLQRSTLDKIKAIASNASVENKVEILEARLNDQLIAFGIFIIQGDKALYLKGAVDDSGKSIGAMYAVFNAFIDKNYKKLIFLDFGGSNDKGLSEFNMKFGAEHNYYINLISNSMPFPLNKWLNRRFKVNEDTD